MRATRPLSLLAATALALAMAVPHASDRAYRWVDEDGNVHYGDRVPPEHTQRRSDVLNRHGVPVGERAGARSEEEREAEARARAAEEERVAQQRRDRILLDTYMSVEEIEMLRDRRMDLIEAQMTVTRQNLDRLGDMQAMLEREAADFQPYSDDPEAPQLPADLSRDIAHTQRSIEVYQRTLEDSEAQHRRMEAQFSRDIARFRELRGTARR